MSNLMLNRYTPVVTGIPQAQTSPKGSAAAGEAEGQSFQEILNQRLAQSRLVFSKHAAARAQERNMDVSESSMARLNEGVRLAKEKGLNETLILVDSMAYLVNVGKGTVITAVNGDMKGNVFTNIDGTVII